MIVIRQLQKEDIDKIAQIWLDGNIDAHDFIPVAYWQNHFCMVKGYVFTGRNICFRR